MCVPVFPTDFHQMLVIKEEDPSDWSPSLHGNQDPGHLHIKEEKEEFWTSQKGEQLKWLEEADIMRSPFTAVSVKTEGDEEKPPSSQLRQSQAEYSREAETPTSCSAKPLKKETDGEDCGGSEFARSLVLSSFLQPNKDEKASVSFDDHDYWQKPLSDSETDDSDSGWRETRAPETALHALKWHVSVKSEESTQDRIKLPFFFNYFTMKILSCVKSYENK